MRRRRAIASALAVLLAGWGAVAAARPVHGLTPPALHVADAAYPAFPDLTADGSRGFDAVWVARRSVMDARLIHGAAAWTTGTSLGGVTGQTQATVAAAPTGAAVIAWTPSGPGTSQTVEMRYRSGFDAPWGRVMQVSAGHRQTLGSVRVAIDAHGQAYVAWRTAAGIELATHPSGARREWLAARLAVRDRGGIASQPGRALSLAVSPSGEVALTWGDQISGGVRTASRSVLRLRVRSKNGTWSSTTRLGVETSPAMQGDAQPQSPVLSTTFGSSSRIFATWQAASRQGTSPRIAIVSSAHGWRRARELELHRAGQYPVIAADPHNFAMAMWINAGGAIRSVELASGGMPAAYKTLGYGAFPTLVAAADGNFAATWNDAAAYRIPRGWCSAQRLGRVEESSVAIALDGRAEVLLNRGGAIVSVALAACKSPHRPSGRADTRTRAHDCPVRPYNDVR